MANDLEDSILKQNIPGRWSTHEDSRGDKRVEDGDDENSEPDEDVVPQTEDEALFDHARYLSSADVPEPIRRGILNDRQKKSKTGVKGVLADYKAACDLDAAQRKATADYRSAVLTTMAEGHKLTAEETILIHQQAVVKVQRDADLSDDDIRSLKRRPAGLWGVGMPPWRPGRAHQRSGRRTRRSGFGPLGR